MFIKNYKVLPEHIDFQGVLDGIYYPYYMENCRHEYLKEVFGIDIEKDFERGLNYTILEYNIRIKKSIPPECIISASSEIIKGHGKYRFEFIEALFIDNAIYAEGHFSAVCLQRSGRPCLPEPIKLYLSKVK